MKRTGLLLAVASAFTLPFQAHADDATRHVKAKELLNVLHIDKVINGLVGSVNAQATSITKRFAPASPTLLQSQAVQSFQSKVMTLTESKVNWPLLEPAYIDLYARTFTDEELDGILAFYKSATGKSFLAKSPALTVDAQKITQDQLIAIQPQLNQLVQDFQRTMAGPAPAATPAPKP